MNRCVQSSLNGQTGQNAQKHVEGESGKKLESVSCLRVWGAVLVIQSMRRPAMRKLVQFGLIGQNGPNVPKLVMEEIKEEKENVCYQKKNQDFLVLDHMMRKKNAI